MVLQKTYIQDHISKRGCINLGELPKYHAKNNHEPIIDKDTFERVQLEIARRAGKYVSSSALPKSHLFAGYIVCGHCGRRYGYKRTAIGTKYEKAVWICATFNTLGKAYCDAQQIPENILIAKTAEILGLPTFDEQAFKAQISEIRVPAHNTLIFVFKSGLEVEAKWQNPSRAKSWTPEMKQMARERQQKINAERRKSNE
jgi:hypothetical protein